LSGNYKKLFFIFDGYQVAMDVCSCAQFQLAMPKYSSTLKWEQRPFRPHYGDLWEIEIEGTPFKQLAGVHVGMVCPEQDQIISMISKIQNLGPNYHSKGRVVADARNCKKNSLDNHNSLDLEVPDWITPQACKARREKIQTGHTADKSVSHMKFYSYLKSHGSRYWFPGYWMRFSEGADDTAWNSFKQVLTCNLNSESARSMFLISLNSHKKMLRPSVVEALRALLLNKTEGEHKRNQTKNHRQPKLDLMEDGEYCIRAQGATLEQPPQPQGFFIPDRIIVEHTVAPAIEECANFVRTQLTGLFGSVAPDLVQFCTQVANLIYGLSVAKPGSDSKPLFLMFCGSFKLLYTVPLRFAKACITLAQDFLQPQASGTNFPAISENIGTIFSGIYEVVTTMFSSKTVRQVSLDAARVKRLENIVRLGTGMSRISTFVIESIKMAITHVRSALSGESVDMLELADKNFDIRGWHRDVTELLSKDGVFMAARDPDIAVRIKQLFDQTASFETALLHAKMSPQLATLFFKTKDQLIKMHRETVAFAPFDKTRTPPLTLHFFGPPGAGKSTLLNFLLKALHMKKNLPFNLETDLYVRNPAQDHWDGYRNQRVTVLDDFMQLTGPETREREIESVVRMHNQVPFPLPMADLANKATTRFTSELLILNSNNDIRPFYPEMECAQALQRRRDVVFRVSGRTEFGEHGKVEQNLIDDYLRSKGLRPGGFVPEAYVFEEFTKGDYHGQGSPTGLKFDWNGVIDYLASLWVSQKEKYARLKEDYDNLEVPGCDSAEWLKLHKTEDQLFRDEPCPAAEAMQVYLDITSEGTEREKELLPRLLAYPDAVNAVSPKLARLKQLLVEQIVWPDLEPIKSFLEGKIASISNFAETNAIMSAVGLLSVAIAGWKFLGPKKPPDPSRPELASITSGDSNTRNVTKRQLHVVSRKTKSMIKGGFMPEGSSDPNGLDLVRGRFLQNQVVLKLVGAETVKTTLGGIAIKERLVLFPDHFFTSCLLDDVVEVFNYRSACICRVVVRDFQLVKVGDDRNDLILARLPKRVPGFADITNHFPERCLNEFTKGSLKLSVVSIKNDSVQPHLMDLGDVHMPTTKMHYNADDTIPYELIRSISYTANTQNGDCGGIVVVLNPGCTRRIVGMHVAGAPQKAYGLAVPLSLELIEDAILLLGELLPESEPVVPQVFVTSDSVDPRNEIHCQSEHMDLLGSVDGTRMIRFPQKTRIVPSQIQGFVSPPTMAPAMLRRTNGISPVEKNVLKADYPPIIFPPTDVDLCCEDLTNHIMSLSSDKDRTILTEEQAINGHPMFPYLNALEVNTSPGYPYVLESNGKNGKFAFLEGVGTPDARCVGLARQLYDERYERALANKGCPTVFYDIPKDEKRTLDKVIEGRTRIFEVGPMDLLILMKQYFGAFLNYVTCNACRCEIAIGTNAAGYDWTVLYNMLMAQDREVIIGDYKNYDKTLPYQLIVATFHVISKYYDDEHDNVRWALFQDTFNSTRLCGAQLYKPRGGNPSGNFLTAMVNSMVNCLLMRLSYLNLVGTISTFKEDVNLKVYGDDMICSVFVGVKEIFHPENIRQFFLKHNITLSNALDKDSKEKLDFVPIEKAEFLKRGFRVTDKRVFAPLNIVVILEMINWVKKTSGEEEALRRNVTDALEELSYHEQKVFEGYAQRIYQACRRVQIEPPIRSYKEWQDLHYQGPY
jgi:hypothetical protein